MVRRDREGSFGECIPPRRTVDRSYYNARRSFSDGGASSITPLLQPSSSQSDSPDAEQENHPLFLSESPTIQSDEEALPSASSLPRYSRILPTPPILRPPRPLPKPKYPRPLLPQRRSDSIQVRMQNKPPLISSSTISLTSSPLTSPNASSSQSSSPSLSTPFTNLRNIKPFHSPIPEKLPPLLPLRASQENDNLLHSLGNTSLRTVPPSRPTPALTFKDTKQPKQFKKVKLRRNARKRDNQPWSPALTSESFRCAGEKAIHDDDLFSVGDSSPSAYSQPSATRR
jgi:hypothetical protein